MTHRLMDMFALTEKGAKGLVKATLLSTLSNITLFLPVALSLLTVKVLLEQPESFQACLGQLCLACLIAVALIYIVAWFQYPSLYINTYEESTERRLRLAEKLRKLPLSFFSRHELSTLTNALCSDTADLDQMFSHYIPQMAASAISTLVVALMMFIYDWRMAIAALWAVPLAILCPILGKRVQDRCGRANISAKLAVAAHIQQTLENVVEIRAFQLEEDDDKAFRKKADRQVRCEIGSELASGIFVSSGFIMLKFAMASCLIVGVTLYAAGSLPLIDFIGFAFASVLVYTPIESLLQNIAATFNTKLRIGRIKAILDEPVQGGQAFFKPSGHDIDFEDVSFCYSAGRTALSHFSMKAKEGEVTALVGPSGSGKSTATRLVSRFWDPDAGRIRIGGVDISSVEPEALLADISTVFQDVTLMNGTILENIRLGRSGASDEEVLKAARLACCDDFALALPDGYDTVLSENGSSLSGGERQRISIARAILKDAPIILLDEATASLDTENESRIQAALSSLLKGRTVLVVAHRLRTVMAADHIVVLKEGRKVEEGTGESLMASQGLFSQMAERQLKSSRWKM